MIAVILAAGLSRRLGQPKLLLPFGEGSIIRCTTEQVIAAGAWEEVIVVLGHEAAAVRQALGGLPVRTIFNPQFSIGMSASLIAGLKAAPPQAEGAMIFLGDQPSVSTEVIRSMRSLSKKSNRPIVVPVYDGVRGNPVFFSRTLFSELMAVEGDKGGRDVILRDPERVETVAFPADLAPRDVDTWEDYEALQASVHRMRG